MFTPLPPSVRQPWPLRRTLAASAAAAFALLLVSAFPFRPDPELSQTAQLVQESDGTRVTGNVSTHLTIEDPTRSGLQSLHRQQTFSIPLRGEVAMLNFPGRRSNPASPTAAAAFPVAVLHSEDPGREQRLAFTDRTGRRHDLIIQRSGRRVLSSRHYVNGELLIAIDSGWRRHNSTWVVESLRASAQTEGRRVSAELVVRRGAVQDRSPAEAAVPPLAEMGLQGLRAIGPRRVEAQEFSCMVAYMMLFGSAGVLATTIVTGSAWMIVPAYFNYVGNIFNVAGSCEG